MDLATKIAHLLVVLIPFSFVLGTFVLMDRVQKGKKKKESSDS